jgi:hypothetical protein
MLTIANPHRHLVPLQVPLIPQTLLRITDVSNRTGIEYPRVTTGTCKIDINYMYIKYTFLFGNNLAGLLVFKVLATVTLLVTVSLVKEALDSGLYLGHLRRTSKTLLVLPWLLALRTLLSTQRTY